MLDLIHFLSPEYWGIAICVAMFAGIVKGTVGFGMPMVLISGLSMIVAPDIALAGLILPTVFSNVTQALRQGVTAARASISRFRWFLMVGGVFLLGSSQLTTKISTALLLGGLGVMIVMFSTLQLMGWRIPVHRSPRRAEITMGAVAGFVGGLSGVWGPPTVALLTALDTEKREQIRVQGVVYGLGAIALLAGHSVSGILNQSTVVFSAVLVLPAMIGMRIGTMLQDRIDQGTFKKTTLILLLIAGANLMRRAWFS